MKLSAKINSQSTINDLVDNLAYPLTKQLLSLINQQLFTDEEIFIFIYTINSVIDRLSLGDSCLILDDNYTNNPNHIIFKIQAEIKQHKIKYNQPQKQSQINQINLSEILQVLNKSSLVQQVDKINHNGIINLNLKPALSHVSLNHVCNSFKLTPLILLKLDTVGGKYLLYISRYFYYEVQVCKIIKQLYMFNQQGSEFELSAAGDSPRRDYSLINLKINNFFSALNYPNPDQIDAIKAAVFNKLSIITGGPGTGKTTTVVLILLLLLQLYEIPHNNLEKNSKYDLNPYLIDGSPILNIVICAPTGKAAMKVRETINQSLDIFTQQLNLSQSVLNELKKINYGTIHKLLGYKKNNIYFKHNAHNLLKVDILVVDESSMISLPLFYKLLSALNVLELKHIIFLGDKNQLSSVEEGHVFAPLIDHYSKLNTRNAGDLFHTNLVHSLRISNRNQGDIILFAEYILSGNFLAAQLLLDNLTSTNLRLKNIALTYIIEELFEANSWVNLHSYLQFLQQHGESEPDVEYIIRNIFNYYTKAIILCVTNSGNLGVDNINQEIENGVKYRLGVNSHTWYVGRPIIILENDYHLELYNGDIGICIVRDGKYLILFEDGRTIIPSILPRYKLAYAITIHKSQGSEYDNVAIILPTLKVLPDLISNTQLLLTKELLYTAVTRARSRVIFYTSIDVIKTAILHNFQRQTGIPYFLSI